MSAHDIHASHGDHHDHDDLHVSKGDYVKGFILAVILTAIPFWLVMGDVIGNFKLAVFAILALAVIQIVVHMVFFLHMNPRSEGGWNMLALIFTLVILVILMAGSLWVMHHMNANMMPHSAHDMRVRP